MIIILGLSAFYHDSAAVLLIDGKLVAAAQEERFTRKKHDASFPLHAIGYVLQEAGIKGEEVTYVAFMRNLLSSSSVFSRLIMFLLQKVSEALLKRYLSG